MEQWAVSTDQRPVTKVRCHHYKFVSFFFVTMGHFDRRLKNAPQSGAGQFSQISLQFPLTYRCTGVTRFSAARCTISASTRPTGGPPWGSCGRPASIRWRPMSPGTCTSHRWMCTTSETAATTCPSSSIWQVGLNVSFRWFNPILSVLRW